MERKIKQRRTDLAQEAHELWQESTEKTSHFTGVVAKEELKQDVHISRVEILNEEGEKALGKPVGLYVTLTLKEEDFGDDFQILGDVVRSEIESLIYDVPKEGHILVIGLGNPAITADAIGPKVQSMTAVTRHLVEQLPEHFGGLRPVSAVSVGVLGTTGVESSEMVRSLVGEIQPSCVIVVDALASRALKRVCKTIQLSNTGITPGSGVGNHCGTLNKETLGVPVIALGVPTVVDGATLVADLLGQEEVSVTGADFFVTPKEIDSEVEKLSKLLAFGINRGLNPSLSLEELNILVG